MPAMGIPSRRKPTPFVPPTTSALDTIFGSTLSGTRNTSQHLVVPLARARFMRSVREAFVTSVACTAPLVSLFTRNASMVPNASSPLSARCARARHVVEEPGDLRPGEVRVDDEAGLLADARLGAFA